MKKCEHNLRELCNFVGYSGCELCDLYKAYRKGRLDAIDEFAEYHFANMPKEEIEEIDKIEEHDKQIRAEAIDEVLRNIEIGIEATGHCDQYTTGFCNALIWIKSCITHEEPQFLEQLKEKNNE